MGKKLTTKEVAERTGRTIVSVRDLISRGLLKSEKVGRDRLVDEDDLGAVPQKSEAGKPLGSKQIHPPGEQVFRHTLTLKETVERRVQEAASKQGLTVPEFLRRLIEEKFS